MIEETSNTEDFLNEYYYKSSRTIRLIKAKERSQLPPKLRYKKPDPPELQEIDKIEKMVLKEPTVKVFQNLMLVPHLNENWKEDITSYKLCLVLFYQPSCWFTMRMLPEYMKAAYSLKQKLGKHCKLVVSDIFIQRKLAKIGYGFATPTMSLFVNGNFKKLYNGNRLGSEIENFMLNAYKEYEKSNKKSRTPM